jgi:hypothetical protein
MVAGFGGIFYARIKQTKFPETCFYLRLSEALCEIAIPQVLRWVSPWAPQIYRETDYADH